MKQDKCKILHMYREGKVSLDETLNNLSLSIVQDSRRKSVHIKDTDENISNLPQEIVKEAKKASEELENLIGLKNVKNLIKEMEAYIYIQKKRRENHLICEPMVLHMIFKGNPGTGKTTVARIVGRMLKEMGMLKNGHLIEIDRSDLVGEYIGHTALKVKKEIQRAIGGILFIDEAYSLARGGEKDFGKEAIDSLVKAMEDYKDEVILILAGYGEEMELFLDSNPGLRSRFPIHIDFKDYNIEELIEIAHKIVKEKEYRLSKGAILKLKDILSNIDTSKTSGNARFIRNIIEKSFRKQALRLKENKNITKEDLILIIEDDIQGDESY